MKAEHVRVFMSDTDDPWFNLAIENWIFRDMDPDQQVLFLWRNRETVVIGRFQNPWTECNVDKMERDNICLARRQSGGGAVFHDLGNTNFTFMASKEKYSKDDNFSIIIEALRRFGIQAERSGRNDILVEGRKVSGSAFKNTVDRSFHHGTLLIDTNLSRLADYLNPSKKKLVSKGIASVRSRVANLTEFRADIDHDVLCDAIIQEFFSFYGTRTEVEHLKRRDLEKNIDLKGYYEELKDWNWRFGKTPKFTHRLEERFDWGEIDLRIEANKGVIREVHIFSDTLISDLVELLVSSLEGVRYDRKSILEVLGQLAEMNPELTQRIAEFTRWLAAEIK